MLRLTIAAVGSNPLIARNLRTTLEFLFQDQIQLPTYCTKDVIADTPADLFVCALSQYVKLRQVLPPDRLVAFKMVPTSRFFSRMAAIPQGETIYVFNNYPAYAECLSACCRSLEINGLKFVPIAYEVLPHEEIKRLLGQAHYVAGTDYFIRSVLLRDPYRQFLSPDVVLVPARHMISIPSSYRLFHRMAALYYKDSVERVHALQKLAVVQPLSIEAAAALERDILCYAGGLYTASLRMTTRSPHPTGTLAADAAEPMCFPEDALQRLPAALAKLGELGEKFAVLAAPFSGREQEFLSI